VLPEFASGRELLPAHTADTVTTHSKKAWTGSTVAKRK